MPDLKKFFLEPETTAQRQYEALRAHFVDGLPQAEAAARFGYTPGSFRVMLHRLRNQEKLEFFLESRHPGPDKAVDPVRQRIVALRKQNLSAYDIADLLQVDGRDLSVSAIAGILREEGFAKLPRRRNDDRPGRSGPEAAEPADARRLDLKPRSFSTRFGGLFLFVPDMVNLNLDSVVDGLDLPGTKMIPAAHAIRSLLALKLFGDARHTHVMSDVFDPGLALFAGLNVIPKSSFLTQYSCRVDPAVYPKLYRNWFDALAGQGWQHGDSFDLDFHTIPFHGEDALVEKHYVSKRSRRQKGLLAFVVSDARNRTFCYVDADVCKNRMNDQVIAFAEFWRDKSGQWPRELVFDSKLTTYAHMNQLNHNGIRFLTLRRRSSGVIKQIHQAPSSAWRRIQLANVARKYRTPKILETRLELKAYDGPLRQIAIKDLGHEQPTILITNDMSGSPAKLIQRYARRMIIENNIADTIDFFHMDALSSTVAMKVNCDLAITVIASCLYRLLAGRIANNYQTAEFRRIFRDFIRATARVCIDENGIDVYYQKRAHNPILLQAEYDKTEIRVPWLGGKKLRLHFG